eukprot:TRINITY_DN11277_c0_g1_i3.p1 TRINITY_DN11277_c0_g1~~TRINITY_DN11277_c0_g1_i3.p1  ORF type:complete len:326 (-),score=76.17 TRINITY_DN11277_c0_g1_i3:463-1440(-)
MAVRLSCHDLAATPEADCLTPTITGSRLEQDVTVFLLEMQYRDVSWITNRTFADFQNLSSSLYEQQVEPVLPGLPRQVLYGENNESVVDARIPTLDAFIKFVGRFHADHVEVRKFLKMELFEKISAVAETSVLSRRSRFSRSTGSEPRLSVSSGHSPRRTSRRLPRRSTTVEESGDAYKQRMLALAQQKLLEAERMQAEEMAKPMCTPPKVNRRSPSAAAEEGDVFFSDDDEMPSKEPAVSPECSGCSDLEACLLADHQRVRAEMQQLRDGTRCSKEIKRKYSNPNLPCEYSWLHRLLMAIVCNNAHTSMQGWLACCVAPHLVQH